MPDASDDYARHGQALGPSYNPLDAIALKSMHAVADARNLAALLVDPDGGGLTEANEVSAQHLLTGLILHLLHEAWERRDLAGLDSHLTPPEQTSMSSLFFALSPLSADKLYVEMVAVGGKPATSPVTSHAASDVRALIDARRMARNDERADPLHSEHRQHVPDLREIISAARVTIVAAARAQLDRADAERDAVRSAAKSKVAWFIGRVSTPAIRTPGHGAWTPR